jgi:replicative superfamily II helicase
MITFDQASGAFTITDLGRIAAKYYIRHSSIEIFNKEFKPKMTEADVLAMLSMSTEVSDFRIDISYQETTWGMYSLTRFKFEKQRSKSLSS